MSGPTPLKSCRRSSPHRSSFPALSRRSARRSLPNLLPADPRLEHLRPREALRVDLGRIAIDYDEVGPFARLERADPVLGEAGVSRAARERVERLSERQPLRRNPPALRLPVDILPADRGGQAREGVRRFHWEVAAERELRSRLQYRLPRICTHK